MRTLNKNKLLFNRIVNCELTMQTDIQNFLTTEKKIDFLKTEFPLNHGTADIFIKNNNKYYFIEIKVRMNSAVFKQILKHKKFSNSLIIVANKPVKKDTQIKWLKNAKKNSINLIWYQDFWKINFKKLIIFKNFFNLERWYKINEN